MPQEEHPSRTPSSRRSSRSRAACSTSTRRTGCTTSSRAIPAACPWCSCTAGPARARAPCTGSSSIPPFYRIVMLRPARRRALDAAGLPRAEHDAAPRRRPGAAARAPRTSSAGWCSAARGARRSPSPMPSTIPQRCLALVLRGIFLCRKSEIDWFLYGLQHDLPRGVARVRRLHSRGRARRPARRLLPPPHRSRSGRAHAGRAALERVRGLVLDAAAQSRAGGRLRLGSRGARASRASRPTTSATTSSCRRISCSTTPRASRRSRASSCRAATTSCAPTVSADDLHRAWPRGALPRRSRRGPFRLRARHPLAPRRRHGGAQGAALRRAPGALRSRAVEARRCRAT